MALENQIIGVESGGNPYARNPRSSAGGLGQFLNGTWLATIKRHRPDIANGRSDAELLQLKFDPNLSREMTAAYAKDNQSYLQAQGIPTTPGNTYLAHFAGPQGAAKLHANPSASAEAILGSKVVEANPFLRGMSGQDVINWAGRKMGQPSSSGAKAMADNLRQKFAPQPETSSSSIEGATAVNMLAGSSGMDRLKSAMAGKSYDPAAIERWQRVTAAGQNVASRATGPAQALLGIAAAGLGSYFEGKERLSKKEYDTAFAEAVKEVKSPAELGALLASSPDEKYRAAGIELIAKNAGQSPDIKTIEVPGDYPGQAPKKAYIIPDGQGGFKRLDIGSGNGGTASEPPGSPQTASSPQPPIITPQGQSASMVNPEPSGAVVGGNPQPMPAVPESAPAQAPAVSQPQQPNTVQGGYQEVPVDLSTLKEPQKGWTYELGPNGKPLFNGSNFKMVSDEELKTRGKAAADKAAAAPEDAFKLKDNIYNIDETFKLANSLVHHPGTPGIAGRMFGGEADIRGTGLDLADVTPGTSQADAFNRHKTLVSQVAMRTMETLKAQSATGATGFGALSEKEMKVLQDSAGNLRTSSSADELVSNYKKFQDRLLEAREKLIDKYKARYGTVPEDIASRQDLIDSATQEAMEDAQRPFVRPRQFLGFDIPGTAVTEERAAPAPAAMPAQAASPAPQAASQFPEPEPGSWQDYLSRFGIRVRQVQ